MTKICLLLSNTGFNEDNLGAHACGPNRGRISSHPAAAGIHPSPFRVAGMAPEEEGT
ncbi:MAG: hypothetical protein ABIJ52_16400 [Pseudomonadota bacterium]